MAPLLALLASAWLALAPAVPSPQDRAAPPVEHDEVDVHDRMNQLIQGIERTLGRIDEHLWGDEAEPSDASAGPLLARLQSAREGARKVIEDIDHLLEIAEHPHEGGGGT